MYFSPSTLGFYDASLHGDTIPGDAVEISEDAYSSLMQGQTIGMSIGTDSAGHPILVDRPPVPKANLIANRRFQAETAGITINGMHLPTDRDSQALVTGAALAAVIDPSYSCQWKTIEGFIELGAQQIIAIASAMRAHVQACFDREAELLDAVAAGTYTDDQLDQGWPA